MKTTTLFNAYAIGLDMVASVEGRNGEDIGCTAKEGRLIRQGVKLSKELRRRMAEYDRWREMMPSVSIPSCWPAYAPITAPGTMTTTAKENDPLVWFSASDERTFAQALESALTEHADVWQALADRDAGK